MNLILFLTRLKCCLTRWKINGINLGQSGGLPNIEITETKRSFQNCTQFTENNVNGYNSDEPIRNCCFCATSCSTCSWAVHPILVTVAPGQKLLFQRSDGLRLRYPDGTPMLQFKSQFSIAPPSWDIIIFARHPVETLLFLHATHLWDIMQYIMCIICILSGTQLTTWLAMLLR